MDSLITAAARALAGGDALGALRHVALREDPAALALRGIAMAQLGDHARARLLLRRAARGFGAAEERARARCVVAEAEVALAMRDLGGSPRALESAARVLEARGDAGNAIHARLVAVRRLLLLGRLDEAQAALARLDARALPPALRAVAELAAADIAARTLRSAAAQAALARARLAAERAGIVALAAEVEAARAALTRPAARSVQSGVERALVLADVEAVLASADLVVDACRRSVARGARVVTLARRPVLFALVRALAEAWPGDVAREALIARAFGPPPKDGGAGGPVSGASRVNESHRARLRVEIGRLRVALGPLAGVDASARGFVLRPRRAAAVTVLLPPIDGESAALVALLADGEAWSTSALALALGESQRTVQRALADLEAERRVYAVGRARARRWMAPPLTGFTTTLLLPAALPLG